MDRRILCDSLIKWVQKRDFIFNQLIVFCFISKIKTLNLNQTINGAGDLTDGVIIALCLKNMLVLKKEKKFIMR